MSKNEPTGDRRHIRCAIYTRKSSEEGLEQEFNSLDAQREACEAYIQSQRHAGWTALPNMYDDGGLSGGTMERPALQRLLEDEARLLGAKSKLMVSGQKKVAPRDAAPLCGPDLGIWGLCGIWI